MIDLPSNSMDRVLDLVVDALELTPADRPAFLQAACGGDDRLRAEVASLLAREPGAREFLNTPAFALAGVELLGPAPGELQAGDTVGDCQIIRLLGEGGMGEVYLARDTGLERQVALKLLKRQLDGEMLLRRFRHERKVLAALTHPNIARLYGGALSPSGRPYLVMEYVEGERLDRHCDGQGLGLTERLALFRKVCAAVTYAHQNLVVHRDLKPANIRVTPEGEPKLLDFGIAKLLDADNTRPAADVTVTMFGALTPEYASPEQVRGEAITTASDVYSLGVILYELLTGERPYRVQSRRPDELARAISEQEPMRPSTVAGRGRTAGTGPRVCGELPSRLRRRLEGDLDNIVAMALRKEPARRYASVAQFAEDIRRHGEGLPVTARRDTLGYRVGKFVGRHKTVAAAAAFVALALVGGLAATTWQGRIARQERDRALLAQTRAETARQKAQLAEKQAERLNGFLQTLLGSVDPENGSGRDLRVVQVLDRASQDMDRELAAEPAILAQAHLTLGQAYTNLKETEPALRHLHAAVDIDRRLYGEDGVVTAHAKAALGVALATLQRQYAEAEPWLRAAFAVERRQPAAEQRDLPDLYKFLGMCLGASKHFDEAAALAEESLSFTRTTYGDQTEPFAKGLTQLGYLEMTLGENAAAEVHFRRASVIYRRLSPGTPLFAVSLSNLAFSLIMQGKLDEPEGLLREAQACYRATVGENSANYHLVLGLHGLLHFQEGDYPTAEADLREGLAYLRPLVPKSDRDVAAGMVAFGLTLTREGKPAEGEPWLRETLELAKTYQLTGMASPDNVEAALAECLCAQKRYAEAEPLLLAGYSRLTTPAGEPDQKTQAAARRLQDFYTAWNKPAEAARFAAQQAPPAKPGPSAPSELKRTESPRTADPTKSK